MEFPNIKSITIVPNPVSTGAYYHVTVEFNDNPLVGGTPDIRMAASPNTEIYAGEIGGLL